MQSEDTLNRIRTAREKLRKEGPTVTRPFADDFERVALPCREADALRDCLVAERATSAIEIGLAYGSSALAIGEALVTTAGSGARHIAIDPFQFSSYSNVGWDALLSAGLRTTATLLEEPSSLALAQLLREGVMVDAAFVDGSHRFHEVFLDLYYLRKLVRPCGLIVLDSDSPSIQAATAYFDKNLGWQPVELTSRLAARRLPSEVVEPPYTDFVPFIP